MLTIALQSHATESYGGLNDGRSSSDSVPDNLEILDYRGTQGVDKGTGFRLPFVMLTTPSRVQVPETHQSSLLNETAREALIGPNMTKTVVLLTVASLGALIFLIINLVGVLLCKGYFRKRAPSHTPSSMYMNSLSHSRRCRYSTILRRFSLESHVHSCCEYNQREQPLTSVSVTCEQQHRRQCRFSSNLMSPEDEPTNSTHLSHPDVNSGTTQPYMNAIERTGICTRDWFRKAKSHRSKSNNKHGRSRSFDEAMFLSTNKGRSIRGHGPLTMSHSPQAN